MNKILQDDISKIWDISRFKIARTPELITTFPEISRSNILPDLLDMPIKLANQKVLTFSEYLHVPIEIILAAFEFEKSINPHWKHYYCYLTTNQGIVRAGKSQRNGGAHFDGMQGTRYKEKFPVCHQYLISSTNPTIYYPHAFNFDNLDAAKHNFFLECDRKKQLDKAVQVEPNCLYLQTAYCVHESPIVKEDCFRSFVRVEFSLKKFNRIGNTINPNLKTNWIYEPQPIPSHLI